MERVSVIDGEKDTNMLVVAPHGFDDNFTPEICESLSYLTGCHAVINRTFQRSKHVDSINDRANCNNVDHVVNDPVVHDEFLTPIIDIHNKFHKKNTLHYTKANQWPQNSPEFFVFFIHGMNHKEPVDLALGYGLGVKKNRYTMESECVACFYESAESHGMSCAIGEPGGRFSARAKTNMTQFFRTVMPRPSVQCLQIEINGKKRRDAQDAIRTAGYLAYSLQTTATGGTQYCPTRSQFSTIS